MYIKDNRWGGNLLQHAEREITEPVLLCDKKGLLNPEAIGFARRPYIESNLAGHFMRKKKWNHWSVFGEDLLFSASIIHLDYTAICSVYILDYETQRFCEKQVFIPVARKVKMPADVFGNVKFINDRISVQLVHIQGETHLSVTIQDFDNEVLHADLHISHPEEDDSLHVVIPRKRDLFQFTSKHHTLPTQGFVKIGKRRYDFNPDYSFAVLDFARGIWPRESEWNWGMASQRIGGKRIGLNFGGKWTDGTGMTENAIFVDGVMTKIHEDVIFMYGTDALMSPWKIHTKFSDQVNLTFTPFFERSTASNMQFAKIKVNQATGYFNGSVKLQDGTILRIRQMLGCAEDRRVKW
ncbi:DUF2804 domain-containing protein [Sporosarcina sp. Sa2YVA2]|uniref:DUF2804 domain-containing protein n=1 Tax=Sporosarcina quadrami TaxID=2762234 RepID=A0ABR8UC44_9BACL|nr:DUF2804 domain-containing protein [Sporosarcina quadrami]